MKTLKEVFDSYLSHVVFDEEMLKKAVRYKLWYLNATRDTLEFFGSNLIGVIPIRFTDRQILRYYDEVLDVDFISLSRDLKKVEAINVDFKVTSDLFNNTLMYVNHRFLTSKALSKKKQVYGASETSTVFFYRTLAALTAHDFKYNANPSIVQAAYSNLSEKFLIKKLGSWNVVIANRVSNLISPDSKHYNDLINYTDDDRVLYAISDSQGSMSSIFRNYYSEIVKAKESNESIGNLSSTVTDVDGDEVFKNKAKAVDNYIADTIRDMMHSDSFIKNDYISIILDLTSNASEETIVQTLRYMSKKLNDNKGKDVEKFISLVMIYSFNYLSTNPELTTSDLAKILHALKNTFGSSRNKDPEFLKMKKLVGTFVKQASNKKIGKSNETAVRTSIMIYIMLYTLTTN